MWIRIRIRNTGSSPPDLDSSNPVPDMDLGPDPVPGVQKQKL